MDDESGWNEILVDGWGPLVRAAVCDRVEDAFSTSRGVLAVAAGDPDGAPAQATERVHETIVAAIAIETGADLHELGSQAAWATYDDVWGELGRRATDGGRFEVVDDAVVETVRTLLLTLPLSLVEHAGAVLGDDGRVMLVRRDGVTLLDVEGVHRWLALDDEADEDTRQRARDLVRLARSRH